MDIISQTSATLLDYLHDPADRAAWGSFAARYGDTIRRWCLRRGLQEWDADEVTQQLLTEIHAKMRNFVYDPARGRFRDWLRTVTHHACDSYLSRDPSRRFRDLVGDLPARGDLDQELDRQARRELMYVVLARVRSHVSTRDWRIFQDLTFAGRPGAEVAEEQGIKVAAAYMVKHRILEKLKDEIRRLGGDEPGWEET